MDFSKKGKKNYSTLVDKTTPNSNTVGNSLKAFLVGGLICTIGQFITNFFTDKQFTDADAALCTSIILIFISAILTSFGLYSKIAKFAGAGSSVPITGFANSVVSPAIEFKKEGFILGMAAKMFVIAGPVIVYGTLSSFAVGLVHYFLR